MPKKHGKRKTLKTEFSGLIKKNKTIKRQKEKL